MSFISDALLEQLMSDGLPIIIIPESMLRKKKKEREKDSEPVIDMRPRFTPSPSPG